MKSVTLVVGDPSGDGHGKIEIYEVKSNLSKKEIKKAFVKGCKKLKIEENRGILEICSDYEDDQISIKDWKKLKEAGLSIEYPFFFQDNEDDAPTIDSYAFLEIYLFLAKQGNSKFEYEILNEDEDNHLWIGGYGLLD